MSPGLKINNGGIFLFIGQRQLNLSIVSGLALVKKTQFPSKITNQWHFLLYILGLYVQHLLLWYPYTCTCSFYHIFNNQLELLTTLKHEMISVSLFTASISCCYFCFCFCWIFLKFKNCFIFSLHVKWSFQLCYYCSIYLVAHRRSSCIIYLTLAAMMDGGQ